MIAMPSGGLRLGPFRGTRAEEMLQPEDEVATEPPSVAGPPDSASGADMPLPPSRRPELASPAREPPSGRSALPASLADPASNVGTVPPSPAGECRRSKPHP
jgi:hypothetical protein